MPIKDGTLPYGKELKHNTVTSHLPNHPGYRPNSDTESRVAGLKSGADIYLT
jgi:hypothetical protein